MVARGKLAQMIEFSLAAEEFSEKTSDPRRAETTPQVSQQMRRQNKGISAPNAQAK
jgi:hypothetical protein